ncbi:hypothetical protein AGMMS50293_15170 [Spirochaetia bacterium]|nr:hypothetical protein AGMMS50293_15170 [Spirochaetia bacterium]
MRNMAKIVTVKSVEAIPDKDRIQRLTFCENGYTVIGDKGIEQGQRLVFVEVDSLLPLRPEFEFLRARCYHEKSNRFLIKPLRMGGSISMGIVFKTDILPERKKPYIAGEDVTAILDILKYEPAEDASKKKGKQPGLVKFLMTYPSTRWLGKLLLPLFRSKRDRHENVPFPSGLIAKSDETTIQNCPEMLERHRDTPCYATIKLEGQSVTFLYNYRNKKLQDFFVCSRTVAYPDRSQKEGIEFWATADACGAAGAIQRYYEQTGKLLAIQGERCGPGVQKNVYGFTETRFFLYTARDIIANRYLSFQELADFSAAANIPLVPVIEEWVNIPLGSIILAVEDADLISARYFFREKTGEAELQYRLKDGEKPAFEKNGVYFHEGIVIRGMNQEFSFKIKSPEYAYWFS